jgi:hypothetical protein
MVDKQERMVWSVSVVVWRGGWGKQDKTRGATGTRIEWRGGGGVSACLMHMAQTPPTHIPTRTYTRTRAHLLQETGNILVARRPLLLWVVDGFRVKVLLRVRLVPGRMPCLLNHPLHGADVCGGEGRG